jgi:hypothetical protein
VAQNQDALAPVLRLIDQFRDVRLCLRQGHFPHDDQYDLNGSHVPGNGARPTPSLFQQPARR